MSTTPTTPLTQEQIEQNFREIAPPLTDAEALFEANRCVYCFDAPCTHACPTHIDVPAFIKKIASGNLTGSARVIFDANPIGATCARVCPVEVLCEGACVENTLMQRPIEIGRLQRYATDYAARTGREVLKAGAPNGKSVGVVGSGPAGLSCATYLARLGYDVTVYERKSLPGGLDTYGMAEYKMTQRVSTEEARQVERLGVKFRLDTEVGRDISVEELESQHDGVFLGVGLGETGRLNIPGEELEGVYDALYVIERIKSRRWETVPLGRTVAVIGAGNTAIDAVTQARRLGAERVLLVYRRGQAEMPAYEYEYTLAKQDAVEFLWHTAPVEVLTDESGARVAALRCVRTEPGEPDASGRRSANVVEGSEFDSPRGHGHQGDGPAEDARVLLKHPGHRGGQVRPRRRRARDDAHGQPEVLRRRRLRQRRARGRGRLADGQARRAGHPPRAHGRARRVRGRARPAGRRDAGR